MNLLRESCHKKHNLIHVSSEIARSLYYYVQWTGHFVCKSDFLVRRSNFESFLMLYTLNGSAELKYEGRIYRIEKNSVMLLDCRNAHEYYPKTDGWEFKYVHFYGADSKKIYEHIVSLYGSCVINGVIGAEKNYDAIYERVRTASPEETCSEIIYHMLIKLIHLKSTVSIENSDVFKLSDIITYIAENYQKNISVTALADIAHLSRCHFSTVFKRFTGFSPYSYILSFRLTATKRMLLSTDRSVEMIAERCGFIDASSFIRTFKKAEGVSPSAYRKGNIN